MDSLAIALHLDVASFVCTFYRLCEAKIAMDGGVVRITIDDELAKKLEGPWALGYELELVFREEDLAHRETAELVTLGSHRFHYLVEQALHKGLFSRIALAPESLPQSTLPVSTVGVRYYQLNSKIAYRPCLATTFAFAFYGERRWEENKTFIIDRINGRVSLLDWQKIFPYIQKVSPKEKDLLKRPTVSLKKSYSKLEQSALDWLVSRDSAWTVIAREKLAAEQEELDAYYQKKTAEEAANNPEAEAHLRQIWQVRLNEQKERFAPKVLVRPLQFAVIAVPEITTVSLRIADGNETKVSSVITPFYSEQTE